MGKRFPVLVCALMVGAAVAVAVAGCGSQADMRNSASATAAAVLRTPMIAVVRQQEEMVRRLEAGNVSGARDSYLVLGEAFGQVLGPLSMKEPGLAQEMGNANTALQALLNQKDPDRAQVGKQAQILVSALRRAADGVGISLTGTAGAQAGPVGAPAAEPAATPAAKVGAPAAKVGAPAAKMGAPAAKMGAPAAKMGAPAAKMGAPAAKTATPAAKTATPTATPAAKAVPPAATTAPVAVLKERSIEVRAREYRFTPPTINVDKGTRVTIKLINEGTDKHEFELDAFRFEIRPIAPRATAQASFVADKAGVFEFACHVDGHYEKGMKGTLVVK